MILLLNLSVEPFFVALLDEDGVVIESQEMPNNRSVGKNLFDFCEKYLADLENLSWVGGVCGPGGFATLRISASLVEAIAEKHNALIRSVTAFEWIGDWISKYSYQRAVLNSFGGKVFLIETSDDMSLKTSPELIDLESIKELKNCWYGALPLKKQVETHYNASHSSQEKIDIYSLYKICVQKESSNDFKIEYLFEAVEK